MDFAIGGFAAIGATFFTNPLDVLKTRLQLQGELKPRGHYEVYYKNVYHAVRVIITKEGILALQKGLSSALLMQGVHNSMKLGTYQWLTNKGYIHDAKNRNVFWKVLVAGALGGGVGAFFSTPFYCVTTRFQSRAAETIAVGYQHKHSGMVHALKKIYKMRGISGLWRGASANMARSVVGASAQLTAFTEAKDFLKGRHEIFRRSTVLTAILASWCGGVCQTVFQTPFDLVCIRLNNQNYDAKGKGLLYDGMFNCFMKIVKSEGLRGLYKGMTANYMKLGRHSSLCLVLWEVLKDYQTKD